ncbi:HAD-IIA family hydrolase [Cellulosilyticum sp. I15G10I2]|uniref:HAD-IIA family hydrolase n=1 Tax=Cellulosilyticum sp. I15G10I2 TaxID=1892843 RepID=UPI00085CD9CC|nr:HAD-IIA family hydrolase [Cellulosilyticum sp. I15G10I2]
MDNKKKKLLEKVRLFVLDMDGTFYLGNRIFPWSLEFLNRIEQSGREYIFFTNNSSRTSDDYIIKLEKMNCYIEEKQILTSGDVTIKYLQMHYPEQKVYLVGTPTVTESFRNAGIHLTEEMPDIVVVSFDITLTYEKLVKACHYIRNGALFMATHLDNNAPTEEGFIPDCGSFCAAITQSTGIKPKYLGKPFKETVEMITAVTGYRPEEMAFVGDRLYTDVATGVNNGATGILVLSGEAALEDIEHSDVKPDAVYTNIGEIGKDLV